MKKTKFLLFVFVSIIIFATIVSARDSTETSCPNYCSDGVYYYSGSYNARTRECDYPSRINCDYACNSEGTACASAPVRDCPDYCSNDIYYHPGTYNTRAGECEYSRSACEYGCNERETVCAEAPAITEPDCLDYCENSIYHYRGSYNSLTRQCDYSYRRACDYGCNEEETTCASAPTTREEAQTDLAIRNISTSTTSYRVGKPITFYVEIENLGDLSTDRVVYATWYVDDVSYEEERIGVMESRRSEKLSMLWEPKKAGNHTVKLVLDPKRTLAEKSITNNMEIFEVGVLLQEDKILPKEPPCNPMPELKDWEYEKKDVPKLPKFDLFDMKDCGIIGLNQTKDYIEETLNLAEEYFNEVAEIHGDMEKDIKDMTEKVAIAEERVDYCIGTQEGWLDIEMLCAASAPIYGGADYLDPIILDDKMISGNLNNMYWRLQSVYYDVHSFESTKEYLEYYLYKITEMCNAKTCISEDYKECLKQQIRHLLEEMEMNKEQVNKKGIKMLKYYLEIKERLDELEEDPEECEGHLLYSLYYEDEEDEEDVNLLPGLIYSTSIKLGGSGIKKIPLTIEEGSEISKEDGSIIITKGDRVFNLGNVEEAIALYVKEREEIDEVGVGVEEDKPVYNIRKTRKVKLLGFIPVDIKITSKIDAENNDLIKEEMPWWGVLASEEPEETACEDDGNQCTEEVVVDGVCTHPASKIGKICDDKDICSYDDHCVGGNCEPGGFMENCLSACGNDKCEYGENPDICPMDCGPCFDGICRWSEMESGICPADCLPACGNGKCEPGEIINCIVDCGYCGDGFCGLNENPDNCPHDCPPGCGNGICEMFEMQQEAPCPVDCATPIGNGICEGGENPQNAPQDCTYCGDKVCAYSEMESGNCPKDCKTDSKNGICEGGENPENAPFDCGYCGDSYCGYLESIQDCPADCLPACGNGKCATDENETCSHDCYPIKENKYPTCGDNVCESDENCAADCLKTCGDGTCSEKESIKSCPTDCKTTCFNKKCELSDISIGCAADCPSECGDGTCSGIENADSCEADCSIKQTKKAEYAKVEEGCGDAFCSSQESAKDCPYDCKGVCGNKVCDSGENYTSCKDDCSEFCGNGKCETGKETEGISENYTMCPADCGYCGDSYCSLIEIGKCLLDCLPLKHCGDGKCLPGEVSTCTLDCEDKEVFVQPVCGNKIIDGTICLNCTWDCGNCGDGICASVEAKHCAYDCFSACGNNICEKDESAENCPFDCAGKV